MKEKLNLRRFKVAHLAAILYAKCFTKNEVVYLSPLPKEIPFLLLGNHSCFFDFIYAYQAVGPAPVSFVVAEKYFNYPVIGPALRYFGAIPKKLAIRDLSCIRSIISAVKKGNSVAIYPEGRVSMWGITEEFNESTANLVKKLKIPVVLVQDTGGFFTTPPYGGKGKISKTKTVIKCLTKEEIEVLSVSDIASEIRKHLSINQYDYIPEDCYSKRLVLSKDVIHLLYRCPHCYELDGLMWQDNCLICSNCDCMGEIQGVLVKWNKEAIPTSVSGLYNHYMKIEEDLFSKQKNIRYSIKIKVVSLKEGKMIYQEQGSVMLTQEELVIESSDRREVIKLQNIEYIPFDCGKNFQVYTKDYYIEMTPEKKSTSTALSVIVEMLKVTKNHNL